MRADIPGKVVSTKSLTPGSFIVCNAREARQLAFVVESHDTFRFLALLNPDDAKLSGKAVLEDGSVAIPQTALMLTSLAVELTSGSDGIRISSSQSVEPGVIYMRDAALVMGISLNAPQTACCDLRTGKMGPFNLNGAVAFPNWRLTQKTIHDEVRILYARP